MSEELLRYIVDSPSEKYGGFHENTVAAAKFALKRIAELEAELTKWKTHRDDEDLEFMRQQSIGGGLAAKQAYINALLHCNKQLEAENAELKKQLSPLSSATPSYVAGLEAERDQYKAERDNIQEDFNGRLKPSYDYVDGQAVSVAEDEIDRLEAERDRLKEDIEKFHDLTSLHFQLAQEHIKAKDKIAALETEVLSLQNRQDMMLDLEVKLHKNYEELRARHAALVEAARELIARIEGLPLRPALTAIGGTLNHSYNKLKAAIAEEV